MTNLMGHIIQVRLSTSLTMFVSKVVKILLLLKNCLVGAKSNLEIKHRHTGYELPI